MTVQKTLYPLTHPQKAIWYTEKTFPGTSIGNVAATMRLIGQIDYVILEKAINLCIEQNDALRIRIIEQENEPLQYIAEYRYIKIDFYDFSKEENSHNLFRWDEQQTKTPFKLIDSDLCYAALLKFGNDEGGFYIKVHHILSDAWGMNLIGSQIMDLYARLKNNSEIPVEKKPSYIDYIISEQSYLASEKFGKDKKYWEAKFATIPEFTNLKPHGATLINPQSKRKSFILSKTLSSQIENFCVSSHISIFTLIFTLMAIYFYRTTAKKDIVFGTSVLNRTNFKEKDTIGMFINSVPVRLSLEGNMEFRTLIWNTLKEWLEILRHQKYHYDFLLDTYRQTHQVTESLYDLTISYQNARLIHKGAFDDFAIRWHSYGYQPESLNIHINDREDRGQYIINFDYLESLFKPLEIEHMYGHFLNLLEDAIKNPGKKITELAILSPHEKQKLLYQSNNSKNDYPRHKTIPQLFEEQVDQTPDRTAVIFEGQKLSYKELDEQANQLANYLIYERKIKPGQFIGVLLDRSINLIIALIGILKSGGVYVPLEPTLPKERLKTLINDAKIVLLISTRKYLGVSNRLQWECKTLEAFLCMDDDNVYTDEAETNKLMDTKLWDYIGLKANNEIEGGGWKNSYNGESFSEKEMEEYANNIFEKIRPYLHKGTRVLEIGCSSGISMFKIAPQVGFYYGTDLAEVFISQNNIKCKVKGIKNIRLSCMPAHEIDKLDEKDFDNIILNSVIQAFSGYNYLRNVIQKAVSLLTENGIIFIGDVMDLDLKQELVDSLTSFKKAHPKAKTKTDLAAELFVSRRFFDDLVFELKGIKEITYSDKIFTLANELTSFRYDVIIQIDKSKEAPGNKQKNKLQQGKDVLKQYGLDRPCSGVTSDNLAYVIYTSGSTGTPKGVMLEHHGIVNLKYFFKNWLNVTRLDRIIQFASISFDASLWEIFMGLLNGASLYIIPTDIINSFSEFENFLIENKITIATLPPNYLVHLNEKHKYPLRKLIAAGSASSLDLLNKWRHKVEYINAYGPTETTICATVWDSGKEADEYESVPIGKPIFNTRVYITDEHGFLLPEGVPGELCVAGDGLAKGYLNRPELTAQEFTGSADIPNERLYKTGDLAKWLPDGSLEFLGRIDNQVKIRGFRIELEEIETKLLDHPSIIEAVVINKKSKNGDSNLIVFYTSTQKLKTPMLRTYLSTILPDYMIPSKFIPLNNIPKLPNGKADRKSLAEFKEKVDKKQKRCEPKNEIEEILIKVWGKVLNIEEVDLDDNFYDIGGDSIKAIQICSELQRYQFSLNIQDLFKNPTIKEVTALIKENELKNTDINIEGQIKLSPIQQWFFEHKLADIHHFNQSLFLYNKKGFLEEKVKKSFVRLMEHHDALRITFSVDEGRVIQSYQPFTDDLSFFTISDLTNHEDYLKIIKEQVDLLQESFDLRKGPIIKIRLFKTIHGDYLLILVHHLVIDGVSWRILLEDFSEVYHHFINNEAVQILPKTDSFKSWVDMLYDYANHKILLQEKAYWAQLEKIKTTVIFQNKSTMVNSYKDSITLTINLSKKETNNLVTKINRVYNTQITDILITALGLTLKDFTKRTRFLINLEGHGREALLRNINITRTLGWFTSYFPFVLDLSDSDDLSYQIKFVKESIRRIPNKGIGYGILRYITASDKKRILSFKTNPEVNFNYLGQFDFSNNDFEVMELFSGLSVSPNQKRICALEINGFIINGVMKFEFNFCTKQIDKGIVMLIADNYKLNLKRLINHCLEKREPQITPSDLGDAQLTIEELELILNHVKNI